MRIRRILGILPLLLLPLPARARQVSGTYGPAVQADALANTPIGGKWDQRASYRFRAGHGGRLEAFRIYVAYDLHKAGYHAGTGGSLRVTLQGDADGWPSGEVLAEAFHDQPLAKGMFPLLALDRPLRLKKGRHYHLVFENADPDPKANFVSVNGLKGRAGDGRQPAFDDDKLSQLVTFVDSQHPKGTEHWTESPDITPILELDYTDGFREGLGYMEVWIGADRPVGGGAAVREVFRVRGRDRRVLGAAVRVRRERGGGPLRVRLEDAEGGELASGEVPADRVGNSQAWVTVPFDGPRRLRGGRSYALVLEAGRDAEYRVYPVRQGRDYGFAPETYFADGHAEFSDGGAWQGWTQWKASGRTDADLQFYFFTGR